MKKILLFILLSVVYSSAIKCTDALYKLSPAMNYLNHDYILVQRNYLHIFQKDTNYREVYFHWKGTISNHKLDWYENTRYILDSKKEDPPYSQKASALEDGEDINYAEDISAGHLVYNRFTTQEDKDTKKTSPYYSSDIAFTKDTTIQVQHLLTEDKTYIRSFFLRNDTLFYLVKTFYGASQDTVVKLDSSKFIYTNNSENEGLCNEYKYNKDSLKFVLNVDVGIEKIKAFTQHGDSIIYSETLPSEYNSRNDYVFLPIEMVLEKGATTAIKKTNILPQTTARKHRYYDLKGRINLNQIPYRVLF